MTTERVLLRNTNLFVVKIFPLPTKSIMLNVKVCVANWRHDQHGRYGVIRGGCRHIYCTDERYHSQHWSGNLSRMLNVA